MQFGSGHKSVASGAEGEFGYNSYCWKTEINS